MKAKKLIINELFASVQRLPVNVLHKELGKLDKNRYQKVLNVLTPKKFLELVEYDSKVEKNSRLWIDGDIKKELLDALSPKLLIRIAEKQVSTCSAWGSWHIEIYGHKDKILEEKNPHCHDLSDYFTISLPQRVAEIMDFLIGSCLEVKAPASEIDRNIFTYKEGREFPFEVINLFSTVHPKVFFPGLNLISEKYFKKTIWLCQKYINGEDDFGLENIFENEYRQGMSGDLDVFNCIGEHISVLKDEYLIFFLNNFCRDIQEILLPKIGKERIMQVHKNGFSIKQLFIPAGWNLFADKKSNEAVLEKLENGKLSVEKLSSGKKVELLGAII